MTPLRRQRARAARAAKALRQMLVSRQAAAAVASILLLIAAPRFCHAVNGRDGDEFENVIRPILARRCYECHSANAGEPEGGLLLDRAEGWLHGGDRGEAIVPGDPDKSLLLAAIRYDDEDLQMPPDGRLPQREIDALEEWIRRGAPAPADSPKTPVASPPKFDLAARRAAHWAWKPPTRVVPPSVADESWPRDDLDRFLLHKLEAAGLQPARCASRLAWLRRVTFDLTGLPPTRRQIESFLADAAPTAAATAVDGLLASPAFGECWAQHWLDLVRYADTKGHEQDFDIPYAWRYRDYVIRALNANVPYDQFVREHIAGDLLDPPRIDPETRTNQSIQATGFWHLGEATHSPVDIRGDEAERIANSLDVFGKTFLGMTVACARCHDHKFDAIAQEDYYALCGFLESSGYQLANVADPALQRQLACQLDDLNKAAARELFAAYAAMMRSQLKQFTSGPASIAEPNHQAPPGASRHVILSYAEGDCPAAWLATGLPFRDGPATPGTLLLRSDEARPIARVLENPAAVSWDLSPKFTGLIRTPTFVAPPEKLWYRYRGEAEVFADVDSHRTVEGPLHGVVKQSLNSPKVAWFAHDLRAYAGHRVHVEFTPRGEFELYEVVASHDEPPLRERPNGAALDAAAFEQALDREAAALDAGAPLDPTNAQLLNWLLEHDDLLPPADPALAAEYAAAAARYAERRQEIESRIPEPEWTLALLDGSGFDEPVHLRGNPRTRAKQPVPRRFLAALDGAMTIPQGSGRQLLAERLVDPANPLTARVFVNRVWSHLFGRGLVATVDNFGALGEPPTNIELLDNLAVEFVDQGWDLKRLIRRIVLSSAYAMSTTPDPRAAEIDPANHLFHAARARRIPAEAVRDAMLAVSGGLNEERYGPGVRVYMTDFMRHNRSPEGSGPLDGDRRRSIYQEVRRNGLNSFLAAFDKPSPFTTVGRRYVSNSASQPLALLNDPFVHLQADAWAESLVTRFADDRAAVRDAYLAAFGREETQAEADRLLTFLANAQTNDPAPAARRQAWAEVCRTLFNVKEFVFLE